MEALTYGPNLLGARYEASERIARRARARLHLQRPGIDYSLASPQGFAFLPCSTQIIKPCFGAWVPLDIKEQVLEDYERICKIPIQPEWQLFGTVKISQRLSNVLMNHNIKEVGELLTVREQELLGWRSFGAKSFAELIKVLRQAIAEVDLLEQESSRATTPCKVVSMEQINKAFEVLSPREKQVVEMRFGFASPSFSTLEDIGKALGGFTREWGRQILAEALHQLRSPQSLALFDNTRQLIIETASRLFKERIVLGIKDLRRELNDQDQLAVGTGPFILPILFLLDHVCGDYFVYINLKNGKEMSLRKKGNRVRTREEEHLGLTKDYQRYRNVLPPFCQPGKGHGQLIWGFGEYQEMMQKRYDISISVEELRFIVGKHQRVEVDKDNFFAKSSPTMLHRIVNIIQEKGEPIRFEKIARLLGGHQGIIHRFLYESDMFVLVGNGLYDLAENHPELKDIPYPAVRRKAYVFGIVYAILRDSDDLLSLNEIYAKMKYDYPSYSWSKRAIDRILNDSLYQNFFHVIKYDRPHLYGLNE